MRGGWRGKRTGPGGPEHGEPRPRRPSQPTARRPLPAARLLPRRGDADHLRGARPRQPVGRVHSGAIRLVGRHRDVRVLLRLRSEEHTSELQSLMRISYAVFCLKKTKNTKSYTCEIVDN